MTNLRILHLYPRELGINGDRGNVTVLARRAAWRGVDAIVIEHHPGSGELPDADLIVVGSGPLSAQRSVHPDLMEHAARLRDVVADGTPLLAVSGGMHLLGTELVLEDGTVLQGAGVLPIRTELTTGRSVGDLVVESSMGALVGYENHGSRVTLEAGASALGTVRSGYGNGGYRNAGSGNGGSGGGGEGVRVGAAIGTHLGGPVLALNPVLADELLGNALPHGGMVFGDGGDKPDGQVSVRQVDEWARLARATVEARPSSY